MRQATNKKYSAYCRPKWTGGTPYPPIKYYKTKTHYIYDIGEKLIGNDRSTRNSKYDTTNAEHPFFETVESVFGMDDKTSDYICSGKSLLHTITGQSRYECRNSPFFKLRSKWHKKLKAQGIEMTPMTVNPIPSGQPPYFELSPTKTQVHNEYSGRTKKLVCVGVAEKTQK